MREQFGVLQAPRHKAAGTEAMLMSFAESRSASQVRDIHALPWRRRWRCDAACEQQQAPPTTPATTTEKVQIGGKPVEVVVKHEQASQSSELIETSDGKQV